MDSNTKRSLLVTVVGVTLFVALLRFSDVLAFAAQSCGSGAAHSGGRHPGTFHQRAHDRAGKAAEAACSARPKSSHSDKSPSSPQLFHHAGRHRAGAGACADPAGAGTGADPSTASICRSRPNIPRWTAYLSAQDADMGWLMHWLEGINWEQLLHKAAAQHRHGAGQCGRCRIRHGERRRDGLLRPHHLRLSVAWDGEPWPTSPYAGVRVSEARATPPGCSGSAGCSGSPSPTFLTGQCSEAVILGVLMAFAFSVFQLPYGSLVGMLTAICAIIPYVGALISCVVSVFLVLLVDPDAGGALPHRLPRGAVH